MYQDYKDLLSVFHAHGVKYLVVGGFAVIYHSQPRFTRDMDLFIKADAENAKAVYAALAEFGASLQDIRPEEFADPNSFFRFGRDPKGFDVLPTIPGVDFDAAWEKRIEVLIDPASGLKANFISAADLLASKLASGRPQDLADADAIRMSAASQRPVEKKPPEPTPGGGRKQ